MHVYPSKLPPIPIKKSFFSIPIQRVVYEADKFILQDRVGFIAYSLDRQFRCKWRNQTPYKSGPESAYTYPGDLISLASPPGKLAVIDLGEAHPFSKRLDFLFFILKLFETQNG